MVVFRLFSRHGHNLMGESPERAPIAETDKITQFPPEIISTKFSKLLRYNIIQTLVVLGNVVDVAVVADGLEVTTGTFNLAFLRPSEL